MSLCKLFLFAFCNPTCQFLSGMFIVSWLELQKQQLKEGVNHSFQSGWGSKFHKVVLGWNGAMLWHNAPVHSHTLWTALKNLSRKLMAKYSVSCVSHVIGGIDQGGRNDKAKKKKRAMFMHSRLYYCKWYHLGVRWKGQVHKNRKVSVWPADLARLSTQSAVGAAAVAVTQLMVAIKILKPLLLWAITQVKSDHTDIFFWFSVTYTKDIIISDVIVIHKSARKL